MQSIDEFTPSTTEPVFGSGLVSQTKSQLSTNNDISDNEKIIPLSESVVYGQDNKSTSNENITNGTTEVISDNTGEDDSSVVHVNGDNEKPTVETNSEVQPAEESSVTEEPSQVESTVPSAEPEPVLSTPVDTVNEGSSSVPTTTPADSQPPVAVEPPTTTIDDNVPEAPVATESEKVETKSKSPRGKAKPPVVPITPTRQSSRGRQAASSSSTNVEENPTIDDTGATTTTTPSSSQNELSKPKKRQAAAIAKDAIAASNQPNSTSGSSNADDGNDQDVILSDGDEDDDVTVGKSKKASPSRKKRGASTSGASATKKARGKNSITSSGDGDSGAGTSEGETIPTPPKKARTSSIKKTPEPPSGEEYVRKLRPRK